LKSWKPWALAVLLMLGIGLYGFFGSQIQLDDLQQVFLTLGVWAPVAYLMLRVLTTTIGIPAFILSVVSGAVFGVGWGAFYSVLGAAIGAVGAFAVARYLARDWAQRTFASNQYLRQLDEGLKANAFWYVLSSRLSPLLPFNILNSLYGLTGVGLRDYFFGTFLGVIPNTIAYAWVGQTGQQALSEGLSWQLGAALTFLGLLSLGPVVWMRLKAPKLEP